MEDHSDNAGRRMTNHDEPVRKRWQAPQLVRMGSVAELTRKMNTHNAKDGAQGQSDRT